MSLGTASLVLACATRSEESEVCSLVTVGVSEDPFRHEEWHAMADIAGGSGSASRAVPLR